MKCAQARASNFSSPLNEITNAVNVVRISLLFYLLTSALFNPITKGSRVYDEWFCDMVNSDGEIR